MKQKIDTAIQKLDPYNLIIILLLLFITACILIGIAISISKYKRRKSVFSFNHLQALLVKFYYNFSKLPITRRYLDQMSKRYEMLCPEDSKALICKTMGISLIIWLLSLIAFLVLFGLKPSFYTAYLVVLSILVINHETLEFYVGSVSVKLLHQFDKFLSDTRHNYYRHGMIDLSIQEAAELSGRVMKLNALKMLDVLEADDKSTAIRLYNETVSNRFLRMFLSVAVYVSEFGDKIAGGTSVLLKNINTLKSDLYIELMNIKDNNYRFSGMIFTVLMPVFMLDVIKSWSVDIQPEMLEFYNGIWGIAVRISIYVSTFIMYIMINELKRQDYTITREHYLIKRISQIRFVKRILNNYEYKYFLKLFKIENLLYRVGETLTAKQFLLKRLLSGALVFICYILLSLSVHKDNRASYLTCTSFISKAGEVIPDRYTNSAYELVNRFVTEYKDKKYEWTKVEEQLKREGSIRSELVFQGIMEEIRVRITKYQNEYFHWYELVFAIGLAKLAYWFPYLMLLYRKKVLYLNMGNEVAQFHTTILMVMYLNNTTVLKILELMESFAVIFKEALKTCINDYSAGDLDALEKLKLRESFEPFRRLVDNLIVADKIGITKAFDEVEEERKVSQEMRNQDYKIAGDKKAVYGMIMSFLPATITVALYWIIPFAWSALSNLAEYDEIMRSLR